MFFMFMSFDVCDSARSVIRVGRAAGMLAYQDVIANRSTIAHRAANSKGVL